MKASMVLAVVLMSASALAQQGDEWTTFPSSTPPANKPAATTPPAATPAPAPAPAPTPAPAKKTAPADAPTSSTAPGDPNATPDVPVRATPPPPHQDPNAKSRVDERLKAAEQGKPIPKTTTTTTQTTSTAAGPATTTTTTTTTDSAGGKAPADATKPGDLPIISRKESIEPGTEPHSPSTWGHGFGDDNERVTVGSVGIGTLHSQSARLGPKGVLRFSALGEYLTQNDFPVKGAQDIRSSGTFAVSFVPVSFLEAYAGYTASANTNSRTSPNLIQALGDLNLGVKGALRLSSNEDSALSGFYIGADLRLLTFSAVGNQSIDRFAVGFKPAVLGTYDFRAITHYFPVLLHVNLGVTLDSTAGLVTNQTLNASEEFALNIDRYHRFDFAFAVEIPVPIVTPFVEYSLAAPLGVPGGQLTGPDGVKVSATSAMPQKLGVGLKVTAIKDLTILAAFDLGLARSVGLGVAATPPWNFLINASFNIDPFQRGETKIVETIRERERKVAEAPKLGKLEGVALDAKTHAPIPGVLVAMVGLGLPPVASDAEGGRILTYDLPVGPVKLHASRDGYKDLEQELKVELGKPKKFELVLEPVEKMATFQLTVASKKKPITAAVVFHGAEEKAAATIADVKDPVKIEAHAGPYGVVVSADGYLAQTRDVQITAGAVMELAFDLQPAPKKMLAIIKDDKIEISQQVHFLTGKATILADSFPLLQQVVDVMLRNNIKRIRVEGHTDNRGNKDDNQKLSDDRAKSVADYLVGQGIDRTRIESAGYGDTKPVAPNLTARGRELNRRVEFLILEK